MKIGERKGRKEERLRLDIDMKKEEVDRRMIKEEMKYKEWD